MQLGIEQLGDRRPLLGLECRADRIVQRQVPARDRQPDPGLRRGGADLAVQRHRPARRAPGDQALQPDRLPVKPDQPADILQRVGEFVEPATRSKHLECALDLHRPTRPDLGQLGRQLKPPAGLEPVVQHPRHLGQRRQVRRLGFQHKRIGRDLHLTPRAWLHAPAALHVKPHPLDHARQVVQLHLVAAGHHLATHPRHPGLGWPTRRRGERRVGGTRRGVGGSARCVGFVGGDRHVGPVGGDAQRAVGRRLTTPRRRRGRGDQPRAVQRRPGRGDRDLRQVQRGLLQPQPALPVGLHLQPQPRQPTRGPHQVPPPPQVFGQQLPVHHRHLETVEIQLQRRRARVEPARQRRAHPRRFVVLSQRKVVSPRSRGPLPQLAGQPHRLQRPQPTRPHLGKPHPCRVQIDHRRQLQPQPRLRPRLGPKHLEV